MGKTLFGKLFIEPVIRVNYFLFKNIAEDRKYDPIRPNDALLSTTATAIILAMSYVAIVFVVFSGNFSIFNIAKVVSGAILALGIEKLFLTFCFNQSLKNHR